MPPIVQFVAQAELPDFEEWTFSDGLAIAGVGLAIVFAALILISLFIATLPRALQMVSRVWPEVDEPHVLEHSEEEPEDDTAVLAAIGFVLHTEFQRQLHRENASK